MLRAAYLVASIARETQMHRPMAGPHQRVPQDHLTARYECWNGKLLRPGRS